MRIILLISALVFISQLAHAQNNGQQYAYRGGQGSGYTHKKVSVTIDANGKVEADFAKPKSQVLSSNNSVSFTDTLLNYDLSAISSEGKWVGLKWVGKELQLLGNLKTGIYWITLIRSGKKETYKLLKT